MAALALLAADAAAGIEGATLDQLPEASRFTGLRNILYAVEWWVFAAFAAFLWLRYVRDATSERVLEEADVALALVDATEGAIAIQDLRVIEMAWEAGCGVIIVVNKWDLIENKETMTAPHFEKAAREKAQIGRAHV